MTKTLSAQQKSSTAAVLKTAADRITLALRVLRDGQDGGCEGGCKKCRCDNCNFCRELDF